MGVLVLERLVRRADPCPHPAHTAPPPLRAGRRRGGGGQPCHAAAVGARRRYCCETRAASYPWRAGQLGCGTTSKCSRGPDAGRAIYAPDLTESTSVKREPGFMCGARAWQVHERTIGCGSVPSGCAARASDYVRISASICRHESACGLTIPASDMINV